MTFLIRLVEVLKRQEMILIQFVNILSGDDARMTFVYKNEGIHYYDELDIKSCAVKFLAIYLS